MDYSASMYNLEGKSYKKLKISFYTSLYMKYLLF